MLDQPSPDQRPAPLRPRRRRSRSAHRRFYGDVLPADERAGLDEAAAVHGLNEEIAVLRVQLRRLLSDQPDDRAAALKAIDLIVRAVSAASRTAQGDDAGDLIERVAAELAPLAALADGDARAAPGPERSNEP